MTRELEDFSIPELPAGRRMIINIKTTWGDKHYVGLSGIEIFANTGDPVAVAKVSFTLASVLCFIQLCKLSRK